MYMLIAGEKTRCSWAWKRSMKLLWAYRWKGDGAWLWAVPGGGRRSHFFWCGPSHKLLRAAWWQRMGLVLAWRPSRREGARKRWRHGEQQLMTVTASTMQRISSVERSRWCWWAIWAVWGGFEAQFRTEFGPVPRHESPLMAGAC